MCGASIDEPPDDVAYAELDEKGYGGNDRQEEREDDEGDSRRGRFVAFNCDVSECCESGCNDSRDDRTDVTESSAAAQKKKKKKKKKKSERQRLPDGKSDRPAIITLVVGPPPDHRRSDGGPER